MVSPYFLDTAEGDYDVLLLRRALLSGGGETVTFVTPEGATSGSSIEHVLHPLDGDETYLLLVAGRDGEPGPYTVELTTFAGIDTDGDGSIAMTEGGFDCDDADPFIGPCAAEIEDNLVDEDCSGHDLPPALLRIHEDPEGGIYLTEEGPLRSCFDPDHPVQELGVLALPSFFALEGSLCELDLEGGLFMGDVDLFRFTPERSGELTVGLDSDDWTASVHPEAFERPSNGVDDDCDGEIDETCFVAALLLLR